MNRRGMGLILGAEAFLLLFASCEKDISGNMGRGEKVEIFFSINTANYHTGGNLVRSAGVSEAGAIMLNDSLYLETTLKPDSEERLRAAEGFVNGQKLCFAAFLTNGMQVGTTAVYSYSTATHKWTPVGDPLGVTPDNSTEYRFVAYSYFGETGAPPTDGSAIDPVHDLVWGRSIDTKIVDETEAARTVSIHMEHQFARVKVQVKCSVAGATIAYLNNIEVDGGQQATLTPFDGDVNWSGTATQDMGMSGTYSAAEVNSEYRTVTPVSPGPAKVKIGGVKVNTNTTTFSGTTEFYSTLDVATNYVLVVDVKRVSNFAYSNIVWTGSKLTFATTPVENAIIPADAQGVFFKWGSLVALRPTGESYTSACILFSPSGTTNYTWANIPYVNETTAPFGDTTDDDDFATYGGVGFSGDKGDICRYITSRTWVSGSWRMPVYGEFGALASNGSGKLSDYTGLESPNGNYYFNTGGSNAYGNRDYGYIRVGGKQVAGTPLRFPSSGYRNPDDGHSYIGGGWYWCASSWGTDNNHVPRSRVVILTSYLAVNTAMRQQGFTIRCVRIN